MKNLLIVSAISLVALSCNSNKAGIKNKAADICAAMEKYEASNPATLLETYDAMAMIELDNDKYGEVSDEQLMDQLNKDCPEGAKKYKQLKLDI